MFEKSLIVNTGRLAGKTILITGGSRGIGKAIGLKAASDGANVVIAAKTTEAHPKLEGTIYTAAKEMEEAGAPGVLACKADIRDEQQVEAVVNDAVRKFGGIDILVNNASAISLTTTLDTPMKRYDLMNSVNARGTFLVSKYCIPHLKKSSNPHILNISPPLLMESRWFKNHVAYTMAKYGMSMCVLGMAEELKPDNIAVNALWPKTAIATAAMEMLGGKDITRNCRKPSVMADAAYLIFNGKSTGQFFIDELVLKDHGIHNFDQYAVDPTQPLTPDFFIPEELLKQFPSYESTFLYKEGDKEESSKSPGKLTTESVFNKIKSALNPETIQSVSAVYSFHITEGEQKEVWYVDMKSDAGSIGKGDPPSGKADVTFISDTQTFMDMFAGKLKPTSAFLAGKLKLKGDMSLAMKLEKLMSKMVSKL